MTILNTLDEHNEVRLFRTLVLTAVYFSVEKLGFIVIDTVQDFTEESFLSRISLLVNSHCHHQI